MQLSGHWIVRIGQVMRLGRCDIQGALAEHLRALAYNLEAKHLKSAQKQQQTLSQSAALEDLYAANIF
jgi:hypothetical protein